MARKEKPIPKYVEREKECENTASLVDILLQGRLKFKPKTQKQEDFINLIKEKEIVIASGPAGCGKSMCALATALELIKEKGSKYKKIVIATPLIEADESIGFLPGSALEKASPYLASSFSLIDKIIGEKSRIQLMEQKIIVVELLSFARGSSFDGALFCLEEAQNTTKAQMKTILTRLGEGSKMIISGDLQQSDRYNDGKYSGLYDALTRLKPLEEIGFFEFGKEDIVRNKIISKILDLYIDEPQEKEIIVKKKEILND